ncbi:MAG: type II toxin-antitoxin system RelE family toxin [Thermoplasmata archaeon]
MAGRVPTPAWRLERTDEFQEDVKRACGRDGGLRSRVEKKIRKILEDPERIGEGKGGALKGLKSEYVNPFVILFSFERTPDNPPGVVHLRGFWHHNDRRYDPNR